MNFILPPSDQHYRPDIDGLRAIAVSLVLFFHGGLFFTGGYIGVDVFFVISGYLITNLILRQHQAGRFELKSFWERRIRRILPAATVMALTTLLAGAVLLFPSDYTELAKSTMAQQLMSSNIFFWRTVGYFQGPAELKPLLHTWSLAVEEQFYLIYPFLLLLLLRLRQTTLRNVLVGATILSYLANEFLVQLYPAATFYLLPTRAWELLIGGLICFMPITVVANAVVANVFSFAGLAMIFAAATMMGSATIFPGRAALIPCLGSFLLIYANTARLTFIGKILACRPLVFVGLLSYSLYLWHWPIFAYTRYWLGNELQLPIVLICLTGCLGLAYLSWRFVETPFRKPQGTASRKPTLVVLSLSIPLLFGVATLVVTYAGFPQRVPPAALEFLAATRSMAFISDSDTADVRSSKLPEFGDPTGMKKCLIWGDSHAMALVPGLDAACKKKRIRGFQATHSSTAPILNFVHVTKFGLNHEALDYSRAIIDYVELQKIDFVVLAGIWAAYANDPAFEEQLRTTLAELLKRKVKIAIVLDVAAQKKRCPP